MRILAVSHPCVTDVNQQFYAELEALGHEVQLIVPANFQDEYTNGPIDVRRWSSYQGGLTEIPVSFGASIPLHTYRRSLRPSIKQFSPDVLFVEEEPYSVSAFQAFIATRGMMMKRVIYSAQNIAKRYPPPFAQFERYVLKHADAAAVVSSEVGETVRQKGFAGDLLSFPLGVDTRQFCVLPDVRAKMRENCGFRDQLVIGYVGRLVEEKGIPFLLQAIQQLGSSSQIAFLLIGNGALLPDVEAVARAYPNNLKVITDAPHRSVHEWMNAMDLLVLPSLTTPTWKEQFGRVLLEAGACGVPLIGSSSGEIPNVIQSIRGGWTFPEADMVAFLQQLRELAHNPARLQEVGKTASTHVHQQFSKQALARQFMENLANLPESKTARSPLATVQGSGRSIVR